MAIQTRADVFPAQITVTDKDGVAKTYDTARVVVTLDHIYVFQDNGPVPTTVFEDRLTSYTPPIPSTRVRSTSQLSQRYAYAETEEGYTCQFLRAGGCGCGSKLKTASLSSLFPENPIPQAVSKDDK